MSNLPNPFNGAVKTEVLELWLGQFATDERDIALKLLSNFRFYSFDTVSSRLRHLHRAITANLNLDASSIWYIPVGYVAKSGSIIAYLYKNQNDVPQERFILASDLSKVRLTKETAVVFLDDYIGSGHQARQVWDAVLSINPRAPEVCSFVFGAIVGTESGIRHLKETTKFLVCAVDHLDDSDLPLNEQSKVFPSEAERQRAREVLEKYGARLYPKAPLGYENSQGLLGFFYSTPNNTLPIFWSTEDGWRPLLPHKESYRDPAFLIGPPSGLAGDVLISSPKKPLLESAKLSEYNISPEISIKIFAEFKRADIFLVLAPIIKTLAISESVFFDLLRLIGELKNLVHEREGVSSSLLVVPSDTPADALGKFIVTASIRMSSTQEIISMIQLLKGFDGALVVKASGDVLGCGLFRATGPTSYPLIPARYHKAARSSLDSRGLLFLFPGDGRVTAFHQGNRILIFRGASWHLQPSDIEAGIRKLAVGYKVDSYALEGVFRLAFQMSDEGKGALLTVGDHEGVLGMAETPETSHMQWPAMHVGSSEPEALLGLMRQDGATIITADGLVVQGMTFLRPPADARGVVEVGRGSKHSTASKISGATHCLSIAISVDGRITVYGRGEALFKLMG